GSRDRARRRGRVRRKHRLGRHPQPEPAADRPVRPGRGRAVGGQGARVQSRI
ncbi:MAG: hypothetical protein AVDCRST_MAG73-471, partial [uncultured Thermomicrobiales bacterium]